QSTEDTRIGDVRPLLPPACLAEEIPLSRKAQDCVVSARQGVQNVLESTDDRLVVIVGPCSIHDVKAAKEYGTRPPAPLLRSHRWTRLRTIRPRRRGNLGWGDGVGRASRNITLAVNPFLERARGLLVSVNEIGVPAGTEFLDTISPQYTADTIAWGAIGARTTESQLHRELASGLSCPIGFKNGTSGAMQIAIDAIRAASCPHYFMGVTHQGLAGIVGTKGNPYCHAIHRGGADGPNYAKEYVTSTSAMLGKAKLPQKVMIDCSHANSSKKHQNQGNPKPRSLTPKLETGVMIESHLFEGRQDLVEGQADKLKYGVSITDACVDWATTESMLQTLADGVKARRAAAK
ncbi:phospho-2-dehydro-3-deoxyheptonate aldolase, partial [Baffinella frigidus]